MIFQKNKQFIALIAFIVLLFSFTPSQAGETSNKNNSTKTIKILTVGNSFAENACTYLSQIAESVPDYKIEYTKANIGGCSLEKHVRLITDCEKDTTLKPYRNKYTLLELLEKEDYDFVTIQQLSHLSFIAESYQPHADILVKFIKEHAPGAKILVYQTWAYAPDCKRFVELGVSRGEMQEGLVENYNTLASRYKTDILPVGEAFYKASVEKEGIDLWNEKDRFHANNNGCYLIGCVWFGKLYGISPQKITFKPEGMSKKTAKYFRELAARNMK